MPAFSYVAVDTQGRTRRGVIEADAPRQARAELRSAGLVPVELSAIGSEAAAAGLGRWFKGGARVSGAELVLITRRFAMLLEAGLTLEQCLDALIEQAQDEPGGPILASVRAEVLAGHGLAAALERHPASFPDLYRALVSAGEQSGELAKVMSRLADYLEERRAMMQGAGLALLYPAIVAVVALLVVAGLLAYVVPQVAQVFQHSRQVLPLLTRAMLWISGMLQGHLLVIGVAAFAAALAARAAYARESVREKWQRLWLKTPVIGSLMQGNDTVRLASTLGILVSSGVPLMQALIAGSRVLKSIPLRRAVEEAVERVREGSPLHKALGSRRVFPPIFIHLISSGEQSGRLAHMLARAARQQQTENEARVRLLAGILEPAVIVAMGVVVLLVVLAILLPIIELNQLVRP